MRDERPFCSPHSTRTDPRNFQEPPRASRPRPHSKINRDRKVPWMVVVGPLERGRGRTLHFQSSIQTLSPNQSQPIRTALHLVEPPLFGRRLRSDPSAHTANPANLPTLLLPVLTVPMLCCNSPLSPVLSTVLPTHSHHGLTLRRLNHLQMWLILK